MREVAGRNPAGPPDLAGAQLRDRVTGSSLDPTRPLVWRRVMPLVPEFELRQGNAVFGEMEPASQHDAAATGECLGRSLELRLETHAFRGILVESSVTSEGGPGPRFRGRYFGWGRITTPGGEILRWRHALTRLYDHILTAPGGVELLRLRPTFLRFGRTETRVLVREAGWRRADLAELVILTWFLRIHTEARGRRVFKKQERRIPRGAAP